MRLSLILTIFTLISGLSFTKEKKQISLEERRWININRLINEEIQTIKMARRASDKIMYRLFELKSEKLKLIKERENKVFMAKKLKYGKKIKRKDSFRKTLRNYHATNNYGRSILKKYPNTQFKAAIYYTLALNSRDFSYDNNELKYLRLAISHSHPRHQVNYLARTSLAEYHYNNKNWKSAIYQYKIVIKNKDDEWYTKNLLNYGWCLLKDHDFAQAIDRLEASYKLSSDQFYVDVRDQAMTGLVSFYVLGKQIERGINFIDKYSNNKNEAHLKLARKSSGKGYYKEAQKIVELLENRVSPQKETELYADLRLFQFDLYKQFHKGDKLLNIAKMLPNTKLNEYQQEEAIRKVSDVVGAKQVILKKDFSKYNKEYDKGILNEVVTYFNILSAVDPKEKAQYEFYKAETYYSVELYKEALGEYKSSLVSYDKTPSKNDLRAKNLDAIFAAIESIKFTKKEKANELEYAFNKYLGYWPSDKKAQKIYPRLFAIYQVRKDFKGMQTSIDRYIKAFKKDDKIQQDLYRVQLDLLIKDENTELLANKITSMQKGYLNFDKKEVKKSETILANILFSKFQKLNDLGKSKEALAGYQQVHYTDYYPKSIKGEAAFNMGMIYTDLEDNLNALKWYQKSFNFYSDKEINQKRPYLEKMALRTALLHNFLNAANLEKFILKNFCKQKNKNLKNFTNAVRNDLANDYITKTFYTMDTYKKCIKAIPTDLKKEVMAHLYENKHDSDLFDFIDDYKLNKVFPDEISYYIESYFWDNYGKSSIKEAQMLGKLRSLNTTQGNLLLRALKKYKRFREKAEVFQKKRVSIKKENPNPNRFIANLTQRINELKSLNDSASKVLSLGHGQISVLMYDELIKLSEAFSKEVLAYKMPINDKNFQNQFKSEMNKIAQGVDKEVEGFKENSQQLIEKYELLITKREDSHLAHNILEISDIRPRASEMAITFGLGK